MFGYQNQQIGFWPSLWLSTAATASAGLITNCLDMSKLRMQVQRAEKAAGGDVQPARFGYKNVFHGVYMIYHREGFLSLFKGTKIMLIIK
jgi:Mitochondrial carrier protein.